MKKKIELQAYHPESGWSYIAEYNSDDSKESSYFYRYIPPYNLESKTYATLNEVALAISNGDYVNNQVEFDDYKKLKNFLINEYSIANPQLKKPTDSYF